MYLYLIWGWRSSLFYFYVCACLSFYLCLGLRKSVYIYLICGWYFCSSIYLFLCVYLSIYFCLGLRMSVCVYTSDLWIMFLFICLSLGLYLSIYLGLGSRKSVCPYISDLWMTFLLVCLSLSLCLFIYVWRLRMSICVYIWLGDDVSFCPSISLFVSIYLGLGLRKGCVKASAAVILVSGDGSSSLMSRWYASGGYVVTVAGEDEDEVRENPAPAASSGPSTFMPLRTESGVWVRLAPAPCRASGRVGVVGVLVGVAMSFLMTLNFCDCDLFFSGSPLGDSEVGGVRQTHTPHWRHPGHGWPWGGVSVVLVRRNSHTFIRSKGWRSSLHLNSFPEMMRIDQVCPPS